VSTSKKFNTDYEYSFWFYKSKFDWILEMLGLLIDYKFADGELEGMLADLSQTTNNDPSKWSGGLHYGNSGSLMRAFINLELTKI
jgi:hypothetical protein